MSLEEQLEQAGSVAATKPEQAVAGYQAIINDSDSTEDALKVLVSIDRLHFPFRYTIREATTCIVYLLYRATGILYNNQYHVVHVIQYHVILARERSQNFAFSEMTCRPKHLLTHAFVRTFWFPFSARVRFDFCLL